MTDPRWYTIPRTTGADAQRAIEQWERERLRLHYGDDLAGSEPPAVVAGPGHEPPDWTVADCYRTLGAFALIAACGAALGYVLAIF